MVPLVPGGSNGTLLKSFCPSRTWNADNFGCTLDICSMFNVFCDFLINLHHNIDGNDLSHFCGIYSMVIWYHKLYLDFSLLRNIFIAFVATLSMLLYTGLNPLYDRNVHHV